jgi:TRAP-type C4-dicarboxylate transport system permease small subunit
MWILGRINRVVNHICLSIAGVFLGLMVFLTCANIFLRRVWMPIQGTFELMGYFGAIVTAFALGYTQMKRGHIAVDVLVAGFKEKIQRVLRLINDSVCMLFFVIVAWQIAKHATTLWRTGEVTETLRIIYYPFTYGVSLGCAVLSLVFLTDLLRTVFSPGEEKK